MRAGEAFVKVVGEINDTLQEQLGRVSPIDEMSMEDLAKLSEVSNPFKPYTYDGSAKDYISARSKKRAQQMIDEAVESGYDFTDLPAQFEGIISGLEDRWFPDMVQIFALGYSFNAPEYQSVTRDKEGFLTLCREVDRDLIAVQVTQFSADPEMREVITHRIDIAGAFVSHLFTLMGKPLTKYAMRDWFYQVYATVSLNCFLAGHMVRSLLEEEAAFEAMMKEND